VNTKGIGLGLHISQMIVKEFGSEIRLVSEYDVGSNFNFSFMLMKNEKDSECQLRRILNPVKKEYAKIHLYSFYPIFRK